MLDDDGCLDRYLNGMKGEHNDKENNYNTLGNTNTALIQKGILYWENESLSDTESDNDDTVSNYDNLFGFNDAATDQQSDALFDGNGVKFGSPICGMAEAGMVGTEDGDSKLQSMLIIVGNVHSKLQSAPIVSEPVCGFMETESQTADDGDLKLEAATIDFQPIGGLTEAQSVTAEEYNSNLKHIATESVDIDGRACITSGEASVKD